MGIAQALLGNPKVIILDEPTVGLDPIQIIEIRDLIRELGKDHTVIFSSHILSEVQTICEKILIISKGRLIAFDEPENLEKRLLAPGEITLLAEGEEDQVRQILAKVPGIASLSLKREGQGRVSALLRTRQEDIYGLSRALFFAFASHNRPLLEMSLKKANLEEIFLELTEQAPDKTQEREAKRP